MSGFSFTEVIMIGIVALVAVGPQRLPGMLKTFGLWVRKLRKMTTEVRAQTGIDDVLRAEGLQGGLTELRGLMRGQAPPVVQPYRPVDDPYRQVEIDVDREYPPEGADAKGALPDDLAADAPDPGAEPLHPPPALVPPPLSPEPPAISSQASAPSPAPAPAAPAPAAPALPEPSAIGSQPSAPNPAPASPALAPAPPRPVPKPSPGTAS